MNLDHAQAKTLTQEIAQVLGDLQHNQRVMVFPPSIHLNTVAAIASVAKGLEVGAQNMHQAASGAYTGEISAAMLKSCDIHTVLLGHSERREYFHEDSALLCQKVDAALENSLEVIFCFGEQKVAESQTTPTTLF